MLFSGAGSTAYPLPPWTVADALVELAWNSAAAERLEYGTRSARVVEPLACPGVFAVPLLALPQREHVSLPIDADQHETRLLQELVRQRLRPAEAARRIDRVEQHRDRFAVSRVRWVEPGVDHAAGRVVRLEVGALTLVGALVERFSGGINDD